MNEPKNEEGSDAAPEGSDVEEEKEGGGDEEEEEEEEIGRKKHRRGDEEEEEEEEEEDDDVSCLPGCPGLLFCFTLSDSRGGVFVLFFNCNLS